MAYASVRTLIPLDNWARVIQLDPIHFNSILTDLRPETSACDSVYAQHDWQDTGRVSREAVAMALKQAEDTVTIYLGYFPVPTWVEEEEHELTRPFKPELSYAVNLDIRGKKQSIATRRGYFIEGGRKAKVLIEAGSVVTYSDSNGDGYNDLATVTVVTPITEPSEICVFYPGKSGADIWEIRPTTVTFAAGVATITFQKYQVPLEVLIEKLANSPGDPNFRAIDGDVDTNFIRTADVYRVYNDPSQQLNFLSEDSCVSCGGTGCIACNEYSESGCMYPRNSRLGVVAVSRSTWDAVTETFVSTSFTNCLLPDKVKIWYRSGYQNRDMDVPLINMDPTWERLIVYYSLTLIDTEICGCDNTKRIISSMRQDLARPTTQGAFAMTSRDLDCPLGTSRAGLMLWKKIISPGTRLVQAR
jgi:hypothetical protein